MCGIVGVFGRYNTGLPRKALSSLSHRGPDDSYSVQNNDFCIGARRLSIIDVRGGRQPLSNETDSVWVAQNGEIYNFLGLREQLVAGGHRFVTKSDTEVIAHLYEDVGLDFPLSISGMFAVALWDDKKKLGVLVRDRVGKKPLYYAQKGKCLYFASEVKALLEIPGFERKLNLEALHYYLSYKHVPCPLSIFQGIHSLPPAHVLTFKDGEMKISRYWQADFSPVCGYSETDWADRIITMLRGSVRRRMISDVPVGFLLSGGVDSGLVVALAAEISESPIDTFTLTYPDEYENKLQDRLSARMIARRYSTHHHEDPVDYPDFPSEFPRIVSSFDEPFAGVTSTYFLSEYISKFVKVAQTGDGADELFGSYLSHRMAAERKQVEEDRRWRYRLLTFTDEEKDELYSKDMRRAVSGISTQEHLGRYFSDLTAQDPLNRMLEAEFNSQLPDQMLTFADRLSMAHSLELRSPYLDKGFVEMAAGIPGELKIKDGETKHILKLAAKRYLPDGIVSRKKEGFILPVTEWLYRDLSGYVREKLDPLELKKHGLFDAERVRELVERFYEREYDYRVGNKVLTLLAFQVWYEIYMEGESV